MAKKGFLETFFGEFLYDDWIAVIDWLLQDDKFLGWTRAELNLFVSEYKKIPAIKNGLFVYDKKSVANPTEYDRKKNRAKQSIIIMVKGQGQAKDIIRHIRNAIAHGRVVLCTRNSIRCIEMTDFGKHGSQNEKSGQTAYMLIPVDLIKELRRIYEENK